MEGKYGVHLVLHYKKLNVLLLLKTVYKRYITNMRIDLIVKSLMLSTLIVHKQNLIFFKATTQVTNNKLTEKFSKI